MSADASCFGLGAVLVQEQPSGDRRAVAFASQLLMPEERPYSQTEKRALTASWAVHRFKEYYSGLEFKLDTDQPRAALLETMDISLLPLRIQRFLMKLMHFQHKVFYVLGKLLATSDTLSRALMDTLLPSQAADAKHICEEVVHPFPGFVSSRVHELHQDQAGDDEHNFLLAYCTKGWPRQSPLPLSIETYWQHHKVFVSNSFRWVSAS